MIGHGLESRRAVRNSLDIESIFVASYLKQMIASFEWNSNYALSKIGGFGNKAAFRFLVPEFAERHIKL